jgi:hypothetical protein
MRDLYDRNEDAGTAWHIPPLLHTCTVSEAPTLTLSFERFHCSITKRTARKGEAAVSEERC